MKTIKKFLSISFTILISVLNHSANAQIVYKNIQPDITLKCSASGCTNSSYLLDLNTDGIADFRINVLFSTSGSSHSPNSYYNSEANIVALNGNSVALSSCYTNFGYYCLAAAITPGSTINSLLTWQTTGGSFYYVSRSCDPWNGCSTIYYGDWGFTPDAFAGLKLISNNQTFYGWVQLSVSVNSKQAYVKIRDMAYDSTPDHSILAGATSGARMEMINSESIQNISVYPNPISNLSTVSFYLSESQNVSLKIFDLNGRLVSTLADRNFGAGENQIVWNTENVNPGIYFLQFQSAKLTRMEKLIVTK